MRMLNQSLSVFILIEFGVLFSKGPELFVSRKKVSNSKEALVKFILESKRELIENKCIIGEFYSGRVKIVFRINYFRDLTFLLKNF